MSRSRRRLRMLQVVVLVIGVTLLARLAWLQTAQAGDMAAAAARIQSLGTTIPAARGAILDRDGRVLVGNRAAYDVRVSPDAPAGSLAGVARLIDESVSVIEQRRTPCGEQGSVVGRCWRGPAGAPATVARDAPLEVAVAVGDADLKGVTVADVGIRDYPSVANAAGVLGYLADAAPDDGLPTGSLVGRTGLEKQYDGQLRGIDGVQVSGRTRTGAGQEASAVAPVAGATLVTTLDAQVQKVLEDSLAQAVAGARAQGYRAAGASALVMDPRDGAVLAMASLPTYDPAIWVDGVSEQQYGRLTDPSAGQPLLLRPLQGTAPPASTFKALTAAAAVNAGFSLQGTYDCPASVTYGGQSFLNYESRAYGPVSMAQALAASCDTVFYRLGQRMWEQDGGLEGGRDADEWVVRTARSFGLGSPTGIDLPGEATGSIPDRADRRVAFQERKDDYCRRAKSGYPEEPDPARAALLKSYAADYCRSGDQLRAGDAMNTAIGQGETLVTPLQLAVAYAAVANGGRRVQPYIGTTLQDAAGRIIEDLRPAGAVSAVDADPSTLAYLRRALSTTSTVGTASDVFAGFPLAEYPVAAKTGTAETDGRQTTSWFASFAPADDPQYVVVVNVDQGGLGARTSGPVARAVYEHVFGVSAP